MSKSKRNIILIFGFILIVNFLFFPCNRIHYGFHYGLQETEKVTESEFLNFLRKQEKKEKLKEKPHYTLEELLGEAELGKTRRVSSDYVKVFFPLVISRANKYKTYVKWESSVFLLILEKKNEARTEKEINEIYHEKNKEFHAQFGYAPYYHQIRAEGFFIELGLLILIVGLPYAILVGVRKIRAVLRKTREADRIKRRKAGIILSLIGVGVLTAFLPLSISAGDETGITLLSIAGITLFLVGIGMVIFSFVPEDANPKK